MFPQIIPSQDYDSLHDNTSKCIVNASFFPNHRNTRFVSSYEYQEYIMLIKFISLALTKYKCLSICNIWYCVEMDFICYNRRDA